MIVAAPSGITLTGFGYAERRPERSLPERPAGGAIEAHRARPVRGSIPEPFLPHVLYLFFGIDNGCDMQRS